MSGSTNTWYAHWLKRFSNTLSQDKKNWITKEMAQAQIDILIEVLAKAESMETAREVRHLIKWYLLNDQKKKDIGD